jgi:hypothetical protein
MSTGDPWGWGGTWYLCPPPYYGYAKINPSHFDVIKETAAELQPIITKYTISVYLDDGIVFDYDVDSPMKAREHVAAIVKTGYRSTPESSNDLTWYPPHRILKVVARDAGESTKYRDRPRAT